ncbi:MAG: response regulator transcription factor [Thermodesulfobacteriota bacterium]
MFRTLIVEDSFLFRRLLKETLQSRFPSMEILEAANGREALQKIDSFNVDLVFMDIELHGENGLELTKRIKAQYPQLITIILTSHDLQEYREAAFQNGADYFLSKGSSTRAEILALVDSILSDRQFDNP